MTVHMSEDQIFTASLRHIVNSDAVRRTVIDTRGYTADVRKDVAAHLAAHLLGRKTNNEIPNEASAIVDIMISTKEWPQICGVAEKSDIMMRYVLTMMLRTLFSSVGSDSPKDAATREMKASWERISSFVRTMEIIRSLNPAGSCALRNAYSELIAHAEKYHGLMERSDDFETVAKIVKFMDSEMRVHAVRDRYRNILMIIDTSASMYGDPELIAKGLALALTKHTLDPYKKMNVMLFSSDLSALVLSDGKDMMELLSFRGNTEKSFADVLKMLMELMKQRTLTATDVILVSNAKGVINDSVFTKDWETYKLSNNVIVITAVAGGDSAGGLTELSDHIVIFNDNTIYGEEMEFAKLIGLLL